MKNQKIKKYGKIKKDETITPFQKLEKSVKNQIEALKTPVKKFLEENPDIQKAFSDAFPPYTPPAVIGSAKKIAGKVKSSVQKYRKP